ncbi:MAG: hypothetical protein V4447_00330 [Pseudomonadota bacterium]
MKLDWKFLLTLLITVAGVAVPVWLWQADQSSKSISIKLATRISIQPKEQGSASGIEISVDGSRLENPHLVVFEIRNNGSKPIPAADFESPVQITVASTTSLIRASITSKTPKDIDTILISGRQGMSLKPTLLNPGDTISITAITSGASPTFESKARVIGISNVVLEDGTAKKPNKIEIAFLLFGSILSLVSFSLVSDFIVNANGVFLRRRAAAFVGIIASFPAVIALQMLLEEVEIQGFWYFMLCYMLLMVPVSIIANVLNTKQKTATSDDKSK